MAASYVLFDKLLWSPSSGAASPGPGAACLPGARRLSGGAVDGAKPWLGAAAQLFYLEYHAHPFWLHLEMALHV